MDDGGDTDKKTMNNTSTESKQKPMPDKNVDSPRISKKVFCSNWLEMDILKDWLIPHENIFKAKCVACNKVLNAGKSELIKHASGHKHEQNMIIMRGMGFSHIDAQSALDSLTDDIEIDASSSRCEYAVDPSSTYDQETQTEHTGNDSTRDVHLERQLDFLSRIANAVERIADSQETLAACKVLHKPS